MNSKNRTLAIVLALFFGGLGAHKFYLEKPGQGIMYLLFCWTFIPSIIGLIEAVGYLGMSDKDFSDKYSPQANSQKDLPIVKISEKGKGNPTWVWAAIIIVAVLILLISLAH